MDSKIIDIKTIEVAGIGPAIHAMRNPMNSWDRSDSRRGKVGEKDKELSIKLTKNGPVHSKHLRMCMVWAEIIAPMYWWKEFDTYRMGVEKLSCSTMHKLMSRKLDISDFAVSLPENVSAYNDMISELNDLIEKYNASDDPEFKKKIFITVVEMLPQSYRQRRTVMMSYEALRNMYIWRKDHKLQAWHIFVDWIKTLPESWMITLED